MTTFTPNFNLPYPDALDEPCDFAQDWCAFTSAVNTVATRFENTINRTVPTIPMARMTLNTPVVIINSGVIPFDSVSVNTAGWVDFDASASDIVTDRAGFFVLTAAVLIDTTTVTGTGLSIQINTGIPNSDGQLDRFLSSVGLCTTNIVQLDSPIAHNVRVSRTGTGNIRVNNATFSVWWHADTATP